MEQEKNEIVKVDDITPQEIVNFGTNAAKVLKDVVSKAGLLKNINGNQYMMFEGWQTVAKFFKTNAGIEWTKPVRDIVDGNDQIVGFEARAYVKKEDGTIISTAESYCGMDEDNWKGKPLFAVKSMAQTRASAKALRQVYSWVVVLAGYQPKPVEEMDGVNQSAKVFNEFKCSDCSVGISGKVKEFSEKIHATPLCMACQDKRKKK